MVLLYSTWLGTVSLLDMLLTSLVLLYCLQKVVQDNCAFTSSISPLLLSAIPLQVLQEARGREVHWNDPNKKGQRGRPADSSGLCGACHSCGGLQTQHIPGVLGTCTHTVRQWIFHLFTVKNAPKIHVYLPSLSCYWVSNISLLATFYYRGPIH